MSDCGNIWTPDCVEITHFTEQIQGPPGADGTSGSGGDKYYLHTQAIPSNLWVVIHNLNKYPSITALVADTNFGCNVRHLDVNSAELSFGAPMIGQASCN